MATTQSVVFAQTPTGTPLNPGATLGGNMNGGEKKSFEILFTAGQFATLTVEQRGLALSVSLFDPANTQIIVMDNPSGAHGPIYLSILAAVTGKFRVDVRSTDDWANPAPFDISLSAVREPSAEDNTRIQAEATFAKARTFIGSASFVNAVREYDAALTLWRQINDKHWEALTQFARGSALHRAGQFKEAGDAYSEALNVPNPQFETNDWRLKASILNDLGFNHVRLGQTEPAIKTLTQARGEYAAHGDRRGQASALSNLGIAYLSSGEPYAALPLFAEALPLRHAENDQGGAIRVLNNIGGAYDTIGDPHKALENYQKALEAMQEMELRQPSADPTNLATVLNNVGSAHDKLGNAGVALDYYQQALEKFRPTAPNRAATLDSIGELYAALGDNERAKHYYDLALNFWNSLQKPDVNLKANLLIHIGQYHVSQNELSQALRFFQEAHDLTNNSIRRAEALTHIGTVLVLQENPQLAVDTFKQALDLQVNRRGEAIARQKRGEAYARLGQNLEAREELDRALNLWRLVQDRRGEAATLHAIAKIAQDQRQLREALEYSEQVIKIIESLRTKVSSHHLRTSYFASQEDYFALNVDLNMQLYETSRDKQFLAAAIRSSERSRARSLIDILNETRIKITEGVSPELLKLEQEAHARLLAKSQAQTQLLSQKFSDKDATAMAREVIQLIRDLDDIRDRIRRTSARFSQLTEPEPIGLTEIQQLLDDDTLLLEYSMGEKRSYVWVIGKKTIEGIPLPARHELQTTALRFSKAFADRNMQPAETAIQRRSRLQQLDTEYEVAGELLSRMLLDRIGPLLGRKRLLIVADGALQTVPFAALPAPTGTVANLQNGQSANQETGKRYLIEDHEIVTLASASVLSVQRNLLANRKQASGVVAVLANAVFQESDPRVKRANSTGAKPKTSNAHDSAASATRSTTSPDLVRALRDIGLDQISWLQYSREEAEAIKKVAPKQGSMFALDFRASRATVMSPQLSDFRIVHFSSHGIVNFEHPEFSGLILSLVDEEGNPQDGYIRLHEIYNLNLPAELVVLSACETGVGKQIKGEGLIALTRGFMYAGAKRVVASLWRVEDAATAELMAEFYKEMFSNKRQPAAALRAAQITMSRSRNKRWQDPYYWAGFVLQGDWQ